MPNSSSSQAKSKSSKSKSPSSSASSASASRSPPAPSTPPPPPPPQPPPQQQPPPPARPKRTYLVASHSVRVTKHGYAIDPVELRYAEVTNKLTPAQRRLSEQPLDPNQPAHRMLALIRGFWSQPAWPKGRPLSAKQQQQQEQTLQQSPRASGPDENILDALVAHFRSMSFYPHTRTAGQMSAAVAQPGSQASSSPPFIHGAGFILRAFAGGGGGGGGGGKKRAPSGTRGSRQRSRHEGKHSPDMSSHYMSWIPRNKDSAIELASDLCKRVEEIFVGEPRILNIKSPCLVLGDIHGNLQDLRTYERSLWPKAPSCLTNNYLFLGDYVDRGDYSVECVLYLFAMKLIAPNRFFLLRGNHEIATIQRQYTFGSECDTKFGQAAGHQMWRAFNRVFNVMPIAAIIDEQVFCAHGGIPRSATEISKLARDIPSPLENPEIQSPAAWEILWNDPITDSELVAMLEMDGGGTQAGASLVNLAPQPGEAAPMAANVSQPPQQQPAPTPNDSAASKPSTSIPNNPRQAPFDSALSFYIKPDQQQQQQQPSGGRPQPEARGATQGGASEQSRGPPQPDQQPAGGSDALRTFPSDTSSIASTSQAQLLNDGFVANIKRGTAFLFSDRAIEHFLEVNRFSHVIRAHEVIPTGFAFHGDGRVITIFSSSQYCGLNNQAACALVDSERIRIIRLDTGDAGE